MELLLVLPLLGMAVAFAALLPFIAVFALLIWAFEQGESGIPFVFIALAISIIFVMKITPLAPKTKPGSWIGEKESAL